MSESAHSSYEEVPYEGIAHYLTHPNHLAALARLFGMSPPEIETCRVLEVGCGRGDNLIPMAFLLPRARFLGIDLSPRQIAEGRAAIAELGLENIELRVQDILDVSPDLSPFDFIVAQGVYSWVPEPVREQMLRLCAAALAPNGLAHISYNTYPGWHMRAMIRDLMVFHTRETRGARARVQASRALMRGMAQVLAKQDSTYARCLREEAAEILDHDESYLAHEHFEETNQPIYLHQFVDRAAAHGLHYLTEAEYWTMAVTQPPELFQAFGDAPLDWLGREQLYDFIKGRAFRHSVLCRADVPCSRTPTARALMSLRITSLVRPAASGPAPGLGQREDFQNFRGALALATNEPLLRAALRVLAEAWPWSLAFETMWGRTQQRLASWGMIAPGYPDAASPEQLAHAMLDAFAHHIVELHVHEPGFITAISEFPRASPVARRQAAAAPRVTNLRHRMVSLNAFDQRVLRHLDGRHDRRALLAAVQGAFQGGIRIEPSQGPPITDPAEVEPILARQLEESLRRLAGGALLVG
jgi:cyclopropane fatty-acyl-phospholipid synthase-like methyltransferase/methyltransferase-like protein